MQQVVKQKKPKKAKKASTSKSKAKHDKITQNLPKTVYSCSAHPQQFMRLIKPDQGKTSKTCRSCGIFLSGKTGYICCPKSNSCFNICSGCRVCSNNHILIKAVSLKHFQDNELHAVNQFNCHACKNKKQVGNQGVYHCIPCDFSICAECMAQNDALWQQQVQQQKLQKITQE